MKKLLRAVVWIVWLVWPFRRPPRRLPLPWSTTPPEPRIEPLANVSGCVPYDAWRRQHPEVPVDSVTLEPLDPAARDKPRVPLAAARQYALEMVGPRKWTPKKPLLIGGVPVQRARVKVLDATLDAEGRARSIEVRVLRLEYPDGRDEQLEFQADGRLLFHIKG